MLTELIRSKGRHGDSILAHINPREAALLQAYGGAGTTNPDTGLPEFYDGFDYSAFEGAYPTEMAAPTPVAEYGAAPAADYGAAPAPTDYTVAPTAAAAPATPTTPGYTGYDYLGEPAAIAAQQPGLYPGGQLPAAGQATYFVPGAEAPIYGATPPTLAAQAPAQESWYKSLGLSEQDVKRLGLGALTAAPLVARNVQQTRRAQQQAAATRQELEALGKPYQATGQEMQRAAQAGELTPASQRAMDVARAQLAQAAATRGGVGAEQAATQLAALQNQLLQAQFDLGLRVANIGDQYVAGAIKTGMQADQAVNQANNAFYASLAQMASPFILGQQPIYAMPGTTTRA